MTKITEMFDHKKGICSITGEPTEYFIRLNTKGFVVQTSYTIYLLESFVTKRWIGDTLFVFIGDEVFYEINDCDMGIVSPVHSENQFRYLVNKNVEDVVSQYFP